MKFWQTFTIFFNPEEILFNSLKSLKNNDNIKYVCVYIL